jgi:soluble lytic murein transglycosylase-like protein
VNLSHPVALMCLSNWKQNLTAFPEPIMTWQRSNTTCILLVAFALCALPAHGQIVSYLDSSGKLVFINAEPTPTGRRAKPADPRAVLVAGVSPQTTQIPPVASSTMGAAGQAYRQKIEEMIRETSARYNVDPALIRAVIETESNWNSTAVSRKGALGLMQLVPGTAQQLGVSNAFDPKQNVDGGVRYLHTLLERYNGDLDKALAAYNAGPGAVDRAKGVPGYRETREYVRKVTDSYFRPGSDRLPHAFGAPRSIYRMVDEDGRVVFTNE